MSEADVVAQLRKKFEQAAATAKDHKISFSVFIYLMDDVLGTVGARRQRLQEFVSQKRNMLKSSITSPHAIRSVDYFEGKLDLLDELEKELGVGGAEPSEFAHARFASEAIKQQLKDGKTICLSCGYEIQADDDLYEGYGCPECHSPLVVKRTQP